MTTEDSGAAIPPDTVRKALEAGERGSSHLIYASTVLRILEAGRLDLVRHHFEGVDLHAVLKELDYLLEVTVGGPTEDALTALRAKLDELI